MDSNMAEENKNSVVIIGAGPAGLTAAYELCRKDTESIVLEKDPGNCPVNASSAAVAAASSAAAS